ncbi:MAG: response regulator [Desulfopila sp.]
MKPLLPRTKIWGAALVLFLFSFVLLASFVVRNDRNASKEQFATHAAVLAVDVWALDISGVASYLQLAADADAFKVLYVVEPDGNVLAREYGSALQGLEKLLYTAGLIRLRTLDADIYNQQRHIGTLVGKQYVRIVFTLANILIFLLFICLSFVFVLFLLSHRNRLEQTVAERTRNLRDSESRFHNLVNLLPEMVWEADNRGHIHYANAAAMNRLDISSTHDTTQCWFDFVDAEQQQSARKSFALAINGHDEGLAEYSARDKNGKHFPVLIRCSAIPRENGDTSGASCIAIDISERHNLENELNQARKMNAIGMMAGGVAHDLNNILSGVVSYPELILMQLAEDSPLRTPVQAIKQSGMQAAEVVSDLLTVARGITASKKPCSIADLVQEYMQSPDFFQLQQIYPNITFSTALHPDTGNIICSAVHFKKCLMNLVANGAEAISGTGRVTITSGSARLAGPALPARDDSAQNSSALQPVKKNYSFIQVTDTGKGLSDTDTERIFEPFYTKKKMGRSGTGLGLAVVWNTMVDHNGWVDVENFEGQTVFSLYFPSTTAQSPAQLQQPDWQSFKGNQQTVLIIDDEKLQRNIATQLLQSLDYNVQSVASGEDAVAYLQTASIDVLLLDMLMEPGINGLETYRRICTLHPGQRAVIASGYSKSAEVDQALELGAGTYITKPYTIDQLGQAIYTALTQN